MSIEMNTRITKQGLAAIIWIRTGCGVINDLINIEICKYEYKHAFQYCNNDTKKNAERKKKHRSNESPTVGKKNQINRF